MIVSVRPIPTRLAAAVVAAGVASAGSIAAVPDHAALPSVSIDVANASAITDALYGLGRAIDSAAYGFALTADAGASLPFDAATAVAIATQAPSLAPNVFSWLVQRYANPSLGYPFYSYAADFNASVIGGLAAELPYPLGPGAPGNGVIIDAVDQLAGVIGGVLSGLPDPAPGQSAAEAFWGTDIGRVLTAANFALIAPGYALYDTASFLGYLPADLEATFEAAIQRPSEIPNYLSYLVHSVLSPNNGLVGNLLIDFTSPLTVLPGPIGQLANDAVTAIRNGLDNLLAALPTPIAPLQPANPIAARVTSTTDTPADTPTATSLPEASLTVSNGISLKASVTGENPSTTTQLGTNSSPGPGTEEESGKADPPDADPASNTKPLTNVVRSGNKVKPGDKFTAKKDSTEESEDEVVDTTASTPPGGAGAGAVGGTTAPDPTADAGDAPSPGTTSDPAGAAA